MSKTLARVALVSGRLGEGWKRGQQEPSSQPPLPSPPLNIAAVKIARGRKLNSSYRDETRRKRRKQTLLAAAS